MTKKYIQEFKSKLTNGDTVTPEELKDFFSRLEGDLKDKKYGLVWESQTEQVIEQLKTNKVYLEEEQDLKITQDPDNPKSNILIEGDNYEALTYLNEINQKVDVIYIDPPYNTGKKDFIYNDHFTDKEDGFRHSQWLSFMDARLRLARELITDDGVIFISIDDNEQAQLKLLCDEVFGESNFVTTFSWISTSSTTTEELDPDNKIKTLGTNLGDIRQTHEYILCYRKTKQFKMGLVQGEQKHLYSRITNKGNKMSGMLIPKGTRSEIKNKVYEGYVGGESDRIYFEGSMVVEDYKLVSDIKLKGPWRNPNMVREYFKGVDVYDRKGQKVKEVYLTKSGVPYMSKYKKGDIPVNTLSGYGDTSKARSELKNILGKDCFNYPKPVNLIKYLIDRVDNPNAIVLDFFAGSGTTGQAVLELNQEDGGNRQFILVTNNENNIARGITYERIKRVIEGYTTPKGKDVSGIPSNLTYYKTKQVSK